MFNHWFIIAINSAISYMYCLSLFFLPYHIFVAYYYVCRPNTSYYSHYHIFVVYFSAGGVIQCMAWDPTASRLAVIFKGNEVLIVY